MYDFVNISTVLSIPMELLVLDISDLFLCVYSKSLVVLTSFYMFVDSLYIVFGNILVHF